MFCACVCAGGVAHPASALLAAAALSGPPFAGDLAPCRPRAPGAPPRGPGARGPDSAPPHLYRGEKGEEEGEGKEEEEGGREEGDGGGNPVQQHQRRQSALVHCAAPHGSGRRAVAVLSPGRSCCGLPGFLLPLRHPRSSSSSFCLLRPPPPAARLPLRGSPSRGHPAAPPGGRGRSVLPLQLGKGCRGTEGGKNRKRGKRQQPPSAPCSS